MIRKQAAGRAEREQVFFPTHPTNEPSLAAATVEAGLEA